MIEPYRLPSRYWIKHSLVDTAVNRHFFHLTLLIIRLLHDAVNTSEVNNETVGITKDEPWPICTYLWRLMKLIKELSQGLFPDWNSNSVTAHSVSSLRCLGLTSLAK